MVFSHYLLGNALIDLHNNRELELIELIEKLKYQTLKQYNQEANTETTVKN